MMLNMLHLSKFPLPRVQFELAKFKWVSLYFWKKSVGKVVSSFFESIQLKIIKCFILIILMYSILPSLSSPMDNLGSSKDYFLFGRKLVDKVIGYFIFFTNRLISKAMHSVLLTGLAWHPKSPRNQFVSTSSSSISASTVSRTQPNSFLHVILLKQFVTVSWNELSITSLPLLPHIKSWKTDFLSYYASISLLTLVRAAEYFLKWKK